MVPIIITAAVTAVIVAVIVWFVATASSSPSTKRPLEVRRRDPEQ